MNKKISKIDAEWRIQLNTEQYHVTREAGTEMAFSGEYYELKDSGTYHCICCDTPLFEAEHKYDSGSGWPSFWAAIADGRIEELADVSHGMQRIEIRCRSCNAHLGHLFKDGPQPSGLRYCVNSASLNFNPTSNDAAKVDPQVKTENTRV